MILNDLKGELQSLKVARKRYMKHVLATPKPYDVEVLEFLDERIGALEQRLTPKNERVQGI